MLLAALMAICCILMIINPDRDTQWPDKALLTKGSLLVAVLLGYASLFTVLGFPLATAGMVLFTSRLFGGSWLASLISSSLISVLSYLVFDRLLEVSLPLGRLWG
jgi:putative tricarboxylic transport membrane protein